VNQAEFSEAVEGLGLARSAFFESTGSTNDIVAAWARDGASGLCVAAADEQTQGRGRSGRRWITPPGSALAFSLLLASEPSFEPGLIGRVSGLGALAVSEALEGILGLKPQIKWPNDVLVNGKKVCGVLPEAHWSGERLQALILGIGINVAASSVPDAEMLNFPATSLEEAHGRAVDAKAVLRAILRRLIAWRPEIGKAQFTQAWEDRLAYKGEAIQLENGTQVIRAELAGLTREGAQRLLVDGEERIFQAGEVHLRPLLTGDLNRLD
jgi:BirA family biotin operon repressor/biotin-[acetyl-CoA-carboxylase] ligase